MVRPNERLWFGQMKGWGPVPLTSAWSVPRFKSRVAGLRQTRACVERAQIRSGCSLVGVGSYTRGDDGHGDVFEHGLAIIRKRKSSASSKVSPSVAQPSRA